MAIKKNLFKLTVNSLNTFQQLLIGDKPAKNKGYITTVIK